MQATNTVQSRQHHDLWGKIWRDHHGKVVIWQMPNIWLIGWAVLTVVSLFFPGNSKPSNILTIAADVSLAIWALLEIFRGVNYFRRALGLVVAIFVVMSLIKSL